MRNQRPDKQQQSIIGKEENSGDLERSCWGGEASDASLLTWMIAGFSINLAILIIGTIVRFECDQFSKIRSEVQCILLILLLG